jgi:PAS domain S-box-containing protein
VGGIIKPVVLTRFWNRRICEVAFLISASIVALYFLAYYSISPFLNDSLSISVPAAGLAMATLFVCLISYIFAPKKYVFISSLLIYLLMSATTAALIISTGGIESPFISLWMLVNIFAAVFWIFWLLPILLTTGAYLVERYISNDLGFTVILVAIFSGVLPLIVGLIIWHGKSGKDEIDNDNKAYKNLANELSTVASQSEVVINAIGDGVIATDSQGIIQLINPAAQNILGWGKQDALALNYRSVLKLVDQKDNPLDPTQDPIQQALNTNQEIRTNDLTAVTSSGSKMMLSLVVSPVGEIGAGVISVFHDITKEKAEEREQAEFISTASHEMRTPVASIEGYLGLALNPQTAWLDDRARSYILKAHESTEHLGQLFQDLLDISKSDDGRLSNNPTVINIVTFLRDIVDDLKQKAIDKNIDLVYTPMPDNATVKHIAPAYSVYLDGAHIREVMNNLIDNAIKYTERGEVTVDVNGEEDRVIIKIKDSGVGIPAEDMSHLFQKFYRVDDKNTRNIGGTGLGLYLSRRLVEIMGGRIWVESVYSKGSTFYVELPRISNQEAKRLSEEGATKNEAQPKPNPFIQTTPEPTQQATPKPSAPPPAPQPKSMDSVNKVPRGQALTPEQIAAYVVKQRALAAQQQVAQSNQLTRPQTLSIPERGPRQK